VRPFNHIGPGQDNRFVVSSFAYQLARIARAGAPPVIGVGNLSPERDFCDVRDIVRAYRLIAQKGRGMYNLCSGQAVAIMKILDTLIAISGMKVEVHQDPARTRPTEVPVVVGSFEKARQELDWEPQIRLEDTLRAVYEYWLANVL
jgi:GDP-4-dehydro-6-deoxy-D-mannose reductase